MRTIVRQSLILLLVAACAALASAFIHREIFSQLSQPALAPDETTWEQITAWQRATPTALILLDARPAIAYQAAHVPGALPLNQHNWEEQLPAMMDMLLRAPDDSVHIAIYCDDRLCKASRDIATRLRTTLGSAINPKNILIIKSGWQGWLDLNRANTNGGANTR